MIASGTAASWNSDLSGNLEGSPKLGHCGCQHHTACEPCWLPSLTLDPAGPAAAGMGHGGHSLRDHHLLVTPSEQMASMTKLMFFALRGTLR